MMLWDKKSKPILALKVGQLVWATVEDVVDNQVAIVDLEGDLLRVVNQSQIPLVVKQRVQLRVSASAPLQFRIVQPGPRTESPHYKIDVEI